MMNSFILLKNNISFSRYLGVFGECANFSICDVIKVVLGSIKMKIRYIVVQLLETIFQLVFRSIVKTGN